MKSTINCFIKKITIGSDYSGVGAFDYAMKRISAVKELEVENKFSCDFDYYARIAYLANHGTEHDLELAQSPQHKKYADGVKKIVLSPDEPTSDQESFLKEANEFCKQFSFYYPFNVYDREIPTESVDIYMTSPPCQSFSLAGQRKGKDDENGRGILFFNSLEFIKVNQPRFFIFENVKGLLSHDKTNPKAEIGNTFQEWINHLGGKSVNGVPILFPEDNAVEYHLYWKVLNSKEHGVPQNRERVFLIGIHEDKDNKFQYPKEEFLEKRLKDVLESEVDEKYFLSEKMVNALVHAKFEFNPHNENDAHSDCITARYAKMGATDPFIKVNEIQKVGFIKQDTQASQVFSEDGVSPTISAGTHGYAMGYVGVNSGEEVTNLQGNDYSNTIRAGGRGSLTDKHNWDIVKIKSATKKGFEEATENDSINFSIPTSDTRRGRVGVGVAQTLDTKCNQGVIVAGNLEGGKWDKQHEQSRRIYSPDGVAPTIHTMQGGGQEPKVVVEDSGKVQQLNNSKESNGKQPYQQNRIYDSEGISPALMREKSDLIIAEKCIPVLTPDRPEKRQNGRRFKEDGDPSFTLTAQDRHGIYDGFRIRRLTPLECFRLQDFPDSHVDNAKAAKVSDSQLYKQAGNSITVRPLEKIINNLPL